MKNIYLILIILWAPIWASGQEALLHANRTKIDGAQDFLKHFRNEINFRADNQGISSADISLIYKQLFDHLSTLGCPISFDTLNISFFKDEKLQPTDSVFTETSENLELLRTYLDSADHVYESRLFTIEFPEIPHESSEKPYKTYLIDEYNHELKSVGRRMGRLIQSAIIEDDDYVTQNSYTRLDLAMANLKLVELELRSYVEKEAEKTSTEDIPIVVKCPTTGIENLENQLLNPRQKTTPFFTATTDLDRSFGVGIFAPTESMLDVGVDLMFRFVPEGEFVVHPKIGMGRGLFHFALGGWWNIMASDFEFTGNVYVIQKNIMGGVGFSNNRVMLTMGWNFQKD